MKKILSLLAVVGISSSAASTVIGCGTENYLNQTKNNAYKDLVNLNQKGQSYNKTYVQSAALARLRTLILDVQYGVSDHKYNSLSLNQNAADLTKLDDLKSKTMQDVFDASFDRNSINTATYTNFKVNGSLGEDGEIYQLGLDKLSNIIPLPDSIKQPLIKIITSLLNVNQDQIAGKLTDLTSTIVQVISGLNATTVVTGLPVGIQQIANLPEISSLGKTSIKKGLDLVFTSSLQTKITTALDTLKNGINFDLSKYQVSDLSSVFLIEVVNAFSLLTGSNTSIAYGEDSTSIKTAVTNAGTNIAKYLKGTSKSYETNKNIYGGVIAIFRALSALSLKLEIYNASTKHNPITNPDNLFGTDKTKINNAVFLNNYLAKKTGELKKDDGTNLIPVEDLKFLNFGQLISNFVNLLGFNQNDLSSSKDKILKFFNILMAEKVDSNNKIFAPNMSVFLTSIFNENAITSDAETLDETLTNAFLTDQPVEAPTKSDDFSMKLDNWIKTDANFQKQPFTTSLGGDLTNLLTGHSFKALIGDDLFKTLSTPLATLKKVWTNGKINLMNLFSTPLQLFLSVANVKNYSYDDLKANDGLLPNYGSYYTSKSLVELINELGKTFGIDGTEYSDTNKDSKDPSAASIKILKYRYMEVERLQKLVDILLFKATDGTESILNQLVDNWNKPDALYEILGYVKSDNPKGSNLNEYQKGKFIDQFLRLFIPQLTNKLGNLKYDDVNKSLANSDNFKFILSGVANFMANIIKGTDYSYWVKAVLSYDQNFVIDPKSNVQFFNLANAKNIVQSGEMIVHFTPVGTPIGPGINISDKKNADFQIKYSRKDPWSKLGFTLIKKL